MVEQGKLRINVLDLKKLALKNGQAPELVVELTLIGEHRWESKGNTKAQQFDATTGNCSWNECIEFSLVDDYTDVKIKVGYYGRFGRFKTIASTRALLSTMMNLDKPNWFMLYTDKKQKHQRGSIKLSFNVHSQSNSSNVEPAQIVGQVKAEPAQFVEQVTTEQLMTERKKFDAITPKQSKSERKKLDGITPKQSKTERKKAEVAKTERKNVDEVKADSLQVDYFKLIANLQAQVTEKDDRIETMQVYIDQLVMKIMQYCPHLLENK